MRKVAVMLPVLVMGCSVINSASAFDAKAIWSPSKTAMTKIYKCFDARENNSKCVTKIMQQQGASQQAIDFTKAIQGRGFMKSYHADGVVGFAKIFEIGADYSEGYYLVNGKPQIINIDEYKFLDNDLWAGNHTAPQVQSLADGGKAYVFTYEIKKCNACKVQGHGKLEFQFAKDGTFMGVKRVK